MKILVRIKYKFYHFQLLVLQKIHTSFYWLVNIFTAVLYFFAGIRDFLTYTI